MATRFVLPFADVGSGVKPADGAQLFFSDTGLPFSSDPRPTYTDSGAGTPNTNPVIADSSGVFADIYLAGAYRAVLKDKNDVQIWSADNVEGVVSQSDAAMIKNFATLAAAVADTGLVDGDALNIAERTTGNGGGAMWDAVLSSTVTENTYNIVQCTGVATISLVLRTKDGVNLVAAGADRTGGTDITPILDVVALLENRIFIPKGLFLLSSKFSTSASEADALLIEGAGWSQTVLMTAGSSGVELLGTANKLTDLTIVDGNAFASVPTTTGAAIDNAITRGNITASTVGLLLNRNNIRTDNVLCRGFDYGIQTNNTKFYMVQYKCRATGNLNGFVSGDGTFAPNFNASHDCEYSSNFAKNVWIRSGFHQFTDTSMELCTDYNVNNTNFPNGGAHIESDGFGIFERCYMEEQNFYNFSRKTKVINPQNMWNAVTFAPLRINGHVFGDVSPNLLNPPHMMSWRSQTAGAVSIDVTNTNIDDHKRYARITASGGAAVNKVLFSHWNSSVRGLTPPNTADISFRVYVGFWVKINSANFTADHPFWRLQFEDTASSLFYGETPTRTMIFDSEGFDNSNTTDWQYVGAQFAVRDTLATGVALSRVRLEVTIEDNAQDASAANRIMDISEPEVRFFYTTPGNQIMLNAPINQDVVNELTIASNIISVIDHLHSVDTQSDASTDNLDTINGEDLYPGFELTIYAANGARSVVVKNGIGNIQLGNTGADITLSNVNMTVTLRYNGTNWQEI